MLTELYSETIDSDVLWNLLLDDDLLRFISEIHC